MASVVARGEESKQKLRDKGVTPGKISSGSVSRSSSGTRTTRSASGEVLKTEERVTVDGEKMIKTTTFDNPAIKGSPGSTDGLPQTENLVDPNTGRQLTPYESYAVTSTQGGQTQEDGTTVYSKYTPPPKTEKRVVKDQFRRDYPYLASETEAKILEKIWSPGSATIRQGLNESAFKQQVESEMTFALSTASTPKTFQDALTNYRTVRKFNLLTDRESYGDIESKNLLKKGVGAFSLGAKTIGGATESLLFEQESKLRYADRQSIGKDETGNYSLNVLKDSARDVATGALKVGRNVIGGAVTDLGTSKTQAVVFGLSFGLGGLSGAFKGAGVTDKVASLASKSVYTRSLVRGSKIGLRTIGAGAIGYSGVKAVQSGDPVAGLSRLTGQILSYGGAFKVGQASGYGVGVGAQRLSSSVAQRVSDVSFPGITGKKAGVFRGSRRVSPQSKTQISKQNKGQTSKQQKGYSVSKDKGENIVRFKDKSVKKFYESQVGSKVKEVRVKENIKTGKLREEVVLKPRGDYVRVTYKNPSGKVKPNTPYPSKTTTSTTSQTVTSGNQLLRTQRQISQLSPGGSAQTTKTVRINDQKGFVRGDPARSRYSAQNIQSDTLRVDLSQQPTPATTGARGGFRGGATPGSIVGTERVTYLTSGLRDLGGASLPLGGVSRSATIPADTVSAIKSGSLFVAVPIEATATDLQSESITSTPQVFSQASGTNSITAQAISYTATPISSTASAIDSVTDSDQAIDSSPFTDSPLSSGGGSRPNSSPDEIFSPPVTPNSPTSRTPFVSNPGRAFPEVPVIPPPFGRSSRLKESFTPGYDVEARIGGVFKKISGSALSRREAIGFGSSIVGNSPSATFRISRSTQPVTGRFFGSSLIGDFDQRAGGLFVEKNEKRINTLGELIGITRKGQQAIQNKRSVFKK